MVYCGDVKDIPGGLYGPIVCHDDQETIFIHNYEAGNIIWGGLLWGENDSQNNMQKEP